MRPEPFDDPMRSPATQHRLPGLRLVVAVSVLALLPAWAAADRQQRNLLLISLDTVRADALGCNGAETETPHLDRLANEGVNFTRARTPVPLTLPAHASIFTATYPPTHTVRDNGAFVLPEAQTTLTELLQEAGFETAAFVGSFVLDRRFGLAQGFDAYDDRNWTGIEMLENVEAERSGEQVFAAFHAWLTQRTDRTPFFAWVHLYDPHAPYEPPEPFHGRYLDDPYAGEIAYTDHIVGRILGAVTERDLLDETIVAVVGDHGEGLGDHGETTHSLLIYNSTLHVPLLIRAPGLVPAKRSVDALVRTIDLAPTLLDLLEIESVLGEGRTLRPLFDGGVATLGTVSYSESLYPRFHLGWSELVGLEGEGHRIVVAPAPELYDLSADPGETENLYDTEREEFRRLYRALTELQAGFPDEQLVAASRADAEVETRLRSLGYAAGPSVPKVDPDADPKARIAAWDALQLGMAQFSGGEFEAAVRTFEHVAKSEPEVPILYEYLGASYMQLERWPEAEEIYERGLKHGIESTRALIDLGLIHRRRGQAARGEQLFEAATQLDPRSVEAHHHLGDQRRAAGRHEAALGSYRRALELNPGYVYSWTGLGITLSAIGLPEEALDAFRRAAELAADEPLGHFNLAVQLERLDLTAEARDEYELFLALSEERSEFDGQRRRAVESIRRLAGQQ